LLDWSRDLFPDRLENELALEGADSAYDAKLLDKLVEYDSRLYETALALVANNKNQNGME
jgi:hypothetical protein